MFRSFQNLFYKNTNNAHLFSFTPYRILSEPGNIIIKVDELNSHSITQELENYNYNELSEYYKNIKEDIEREFSETINKFDAICFHNTTNVLVTLTKVPKESIRENSVICIKYMKN